MVHFLAFVNTGGSTKRHQVPKDAPANRCDKSGSYTQVTVSSRYRNVRYQGDSRLRPYETEYPDHPILPCPALSYPIETIHVI
jgi:hypothetical protein